MAENGDVKTWDFDPWAERYDRVVAADSATYHARYVEVLDAVVAAAGIGPGMRVLDIGTGTGALALRCLARGAEVVGLDPSAGMLAQAREKAGAEVRLELQQAADPFLRIPYPDASFDAVVSSYAYHHVHHAQRAESVREMVRVLKPGGRWVVGDLAFESKAAERQALRELCWLEEEYFARIDALREAFASLEMALSAQQMTPVTWVLRALKPV